MIPKITHTPMVTKMGKSVSSSSSNTFRTGYGSSISNTDPNNSNSSYSMGRMREVSNTKQGQVKAIDGAIINQYLNKKYSWSK